jgi:hypothetical protein
MGMICPMIPRSVRLVLFGSLFAVLISLRLTQAVFAESLPIVPGLVGFGTKTVAGSGRHSKRPRAAIYVVSSLAPHGRGSLRECIEGRTPRTCVFSVGGEIRLKDSIRIRSPYITIAGQTAPPPGITLTGAGIIVSTHDVLIQHIAIRPGDARGGQPPEERDCVSIGAPPPKSAYNVVIDHLSLTWAIDENISTAYPSTHDVTITNNLIAEGLHRSIHPKGPHSKGLMIGDDSRRITVTKNLLAFNEERNPYLKPGTSTEFINNVVYGWGPNGGWSLCNISSYDQLEPPIDLTFIGNVYKPGPLSARLWPIYGKRINPASSIFERDTISPQPFTEARTTKYVAAAIPSIISPGITIQSSLAAYDGVLTQAGCRPNQRGSIDRRIIENVRQGTGDIKDCIAGCSRPTGRLIPRRPTHRSLKLPHKPFGDSNRDGYTNLENWLHKRALAVERLRR